MDGIPLATQNPVIRPAQPRDAIALASCIDAAHAHYADRISDMPSVSEECAENTTNHKVWVALQRNEVIAGLVLVPGDGFMKLANLAVHPNYDGKGLGRKRITLSEREVRQQGFGEMRLNTHVDMPEYAELYQHLG